MHKIHIPGLAQFVLLFFWQSPNTVFITITFFRCLQLIDKVPLVITEQTGETSFSVKHLLSFTIRIIIAIFLSSKIKICIVSN